MSVSVTILRKTLVTPFYRQNAGFFVFFFVLLFGAVGVVDGAGLIEFHSSLIRGMLTNWVMLTLVFLFWYLYAGKTAQFVLSRINDPAFAFLQSVFLLTSMKIFRMMAWIQFLLLAPIIFYAIIVFVTGMHLHAYFASLTTVCFVIAICLLNAIRFQKQIFQPGLVNPGNRMFLFFKNTTLSYWSIFIRYAGLKKKWLIAGIKLYSCTILFCMIQRETSVGYDLNMIWLFFSLGILGHGLLIHQFRNFEVTSLSFYRAVPVSLPVRFRQYLILYFIILIPETIILVFLSAGSLRIVDAMLFFLLGLSLLVFMNSLLFIRFFRTRQYLKIILGLFFTVHLSILINSLWWLAVVFFLSGALIFNACYYRFEWNEDIT